MDRWQQIDELFAQALAYPSAERPALLAACPDPDLRREVASLLDHHPIAGAFLEEAVGGAISAWAASEADTAQASVMGRRIGAYEVTGIIGQGGMGAVYRARRADGAFEHDVAIKVVRHGFETAAALERFRQERQILARLTHPDIARLLDGGTIRDERGLDTPYLVLEYVEGSAITSYCAARALPVSDRLRLFRRICDAVLHAHQRLIVHRDLKPSHILVTADGQPKLLDFGIAKLLSDGVAEAPAITAAGFSMLTPEYASPEQVRGEPPAVATDVYALGAILYELLTNQKAHHLQTRSPVEIGRVICETPITLPSVAVASLSPPTPAAAKLRRQLVGDLDTIVMKALHKEAARRYASVEQLSEDLRRYLAGLPVSARPDTAVYRLGKLVRRHKTLVAALVLALASLSGGLLISMQQTRRANQRFDDVRTLANRLLKEVEPAIRDIPGTAAAQGVLVRLGTEYLDRLRADAWGDRDLLLEVAEGYYSVGAVEGSIDTENFGRYDTALETQAKALAIANQLADTGRVDARLALLRSRVLLMSGTLLSVKGARTEAAARYQQALVDAERGLREQPDDRRLIGVATSAENRSGDLLLTMGRVAAAAAFFEKALTRAERASHPRQRTVTTRARLAMALREAGHAERAHALFRVCVEETQASLRGSPRSTGLRHTLTLLQADVGLTLAGREGPSLARTAEGLAAYRAAQATGQALVQAAGHDPHSVLAWMEAVVGFGTIAAEADPPAAIAALTDSLVQLAPLLRDNAVDDARVLAARARSGLSRALTRLGRAADARPHAEAAAGDLHMLADGDRENAAFGDALVMARVHLGEVHGGLGDAAEADAHLRHAVRLAEGLVAATPDRPRARALQAIARSRLAAFLATRGSAGGAEARALLEASRTEWESWSRRGWPEMHAQAQIRQLAGR